MIELNLKFDHHDKGFDRTGYSVKVKENGVNRWRHINYQSGQWFWATATFESDYPVNANRYSIFTDKPPWQLVNHGKEKQ